MAANAEREADRNTRAPRAHALGLVNGVSDTQPAILKAAMETAQKIAMKSPLAVHGSKV